MVKNNEKNTGNDSKFSLRDLSELRQIAKTPINEICLSCRTYHLLETQFKTVGDVVQSTKEELLGIKGLGNQSLEDLKRVLKELDPRLYFGMNCLSDTKKVSISQATAESKNMKTPIAGRTVRLIGEINPESVRRIADKLDELVAESNDLITFFISSGGGSTAATYCLYEYITEVLIPPNLQTVVLGSANSMAPILLLAGDHRVISSYATLFFHPIGRTFEKTRLTPAETEEVLIDLKASNKKYIDIIVRRTGMKREKVAKIIKSETTLSPEQSKDLGFVHEILKKK
jgi:ATP-dependent protease ClpP protease subunit